MKAQWAGIAAAAAALMFAGQAAAVDEAAAMALAKKSGCFNCHAIDSEVFGPPWVEIGRKYAGDAGAQARLVGVVKNGGTGNWGPNTMPAQKVSDDNANTLIQFILSLK